MFSFPGMNQVHLISKRNKYSYFFVAVCLFCFFFSSDSDTYHLSVYLSLRVTQEILRGKRLWVCYCFSLHKVRNSNVCNVLCNRSFVKTDRNQMFVHFREQVQSEEMLQMIIFRFV